MLFIAIFFTLDWWKNVFTQTETVPQRLQKQKLCCLNWSQTPHLLSSTWPSTTSRSDFRHTSDEIYAMDLKIFCSEVSNTCVKVEWFKLNTWLSLSFFQICMNDDLVAKRYAYYSTLPAGSNGLNGANWLPVRLSSSILTQTASKSSDRQKAQTKQLCDPTGTTRENTTLLRIKRHEQMQTNKKTQLSLKYFKTFHWPFLIYSIFNTI